MTKVTNFKSDYTNAANRFDFSVKLMRKHGRIAAECALLQFRHHGDTTLLNDFAERMDALGAHAERSKYVKWVVAHAEIFFYRNTFKKDFEHELKPADFQPTDKVRCWVDDAAFITSFLEWKPEAKLEFFDASEVIKALETVVKKYDNAEKKKASSVEAVNTVAELRRIVATMGGKLKTGGYNVAA